MPLLLNMPLLLILLGAGGAVAGALLGVIKELIEIIEMREMREELQSLALRQNVMDEKLPKLTAAFNNPSEYKKSKHKETFLDLMEIFGFDCVTIASKVDVFGGTTPLKSAELDYTFRWDGQAESASYEPLQKHLCDCGISTVIIGEGHGLPDGLLYYQELWTLKDNVSLRSEELRKAGKEPVFKYLLEGRTDLVRTRFSDQPLGKHNNRYFIEIKRVEDFVEEDSLREAVLQLIGGNASNSFHSPPVLLTDLAKLHYVLYITLVGNPTVKLKFKLNVIRMPSFGAAIAFLEEHTAERKSVTLHLGRRPTPQYSTARAKKNTSETAEYLGDVADIFDSVHLE